VATLRSRIARATSPFVWRSAGRSARKLHGFALAEAASFLDMRMAAARTDSPERRVLYVRHALDEARHARIFSSASAELRRKGGREPFGPPHADASDLHETLGELGMIAFVHRAERRGRMQFEAYRDWFARVGDEKSRAMFDAVLVDERRHEAYSRDVLLALAGSERAARAAMRRAALWEAWRTWRSAGRAIAGALYTTIMIVLYVSLAPIAFLARIARPRTTGWRLPTRS
jgi:rubrerythrin